MASGSQCIDMHSTDRIRMAIDVIRPRYRESQMSSLLRWQPRAHDPVMLAFEIGSGVVANRMIETRTGNTNDCGTGERSGG